VHTSAIEPLPHQLSAVYEDMLPRLPLRYVLADDPGAGKMMPDGTPVPTVRTVTENCRTLHVEDFGFED
jgi:hypothetical protein